MRHSIIAFLIFAGFASTISAQDLCSPLLQHGITDVTQRYSANHAVVSNYQRHCGSIDQSSSDSLVLQTEAELFGFGGGNNNTDVQRARRRIENWCNINREFAEANSSLAEVTRTINQSALQAFNQCQAFQRRDIFVSVQRSDDTARTVTITIDSRSSADYRFTGLITEGYTCDYFTDDSETGLTPEIKIVSTDRPNLPISNGNIHISCLRDEPTITEVSGVGEIQYAYGSIQVLTNDRALQLSMPEIVKTYYVTPPGTILPMVGPNCPNGWDAYEEAQGRFLIGTGITEGVEFKLGDKQGSVGHNHSGTTSSTGKVRGEDDKDHSAAPANHSHSFTTSTSQNLPPYLVVNYCVRTK
ncbi:MAG: hypothetical protein ABJD13_02480 [Paracoccaceae bacterium]